MPNAKKCYISFIYRSRRLLKMWEWLDLKMDLKIHPGKCLESMILHAFVRMSICSHIANIRCGEVGFRIWLKHHWILFQTPREKMKTHEANDDPTCFCLTEYLQPYISPNVFTFPSMAVCVFWIYGKGKYLWHSTARLRATEVFCCTLICDSWF